MKWKYYRAVHHETIELTATLKRRLDTMGTTLSLACIAKEYSGEIPWTSVVDSHVSHDLFKVTYNLVLNDRIKKKYE
jgi:hypothetical protein